MTQEDKLRQLALAQKEVIRAADETIASQTAVIAQLERALVTRAAGADALRAASAGCRAAIEKAADLAGDAQQALAKGDTAGAAWRLDTARELLERQGHDLERAERTAQDPEAEVLSAESLAGDAILPSVPLRLLDTPANRRLESALREAVEAAAEVTTERGRSVDESELVVELAARLTEVRLELYGPAGHGE